MLRDGTAEARAMTAQTSPTTGRRYPLDDGVHRVSDAAGDRVCADGRRRRAGQNGPHTTGTDADLVADADGAWPRYPSMGKDIAKYRPAAGAGLGGS